MDALVLAGGSMPPELADIGSTLEGVSRPDSSGSGERATITIASQPMINYVVQALRDTKSLQRIVVVGNPIALDVAIAAVPNAIGVPAQDAIVDNLSAGMQMTESLQVLVCTCDIPLVTPATFEELIEGARQRNLEAACSIVRREICETAFPTGRRTYATLTDGTFTAGNVFIAPRDAVQRLNELVAAGYQARKNPLALARLLGLGFLIKVLSKRLSVAEVEQKVSQILQCRAGAIEMNDATVAFDVDKLDDYIVARQVLEQRQVSRQSAFQQQAF